MPIRVGIVGLGFMGKVHYETYGALEGAKVAALCVECEVRAARTGRPVRVRL